jgi:hypothetical protein
VTSTTSIELDRVRAAQAAVEAARVELRESVATIGAALGVSRQRAHKLLGEAPSRRQAGTPELGTSAAQEVERTDRSALVIRLAELDARWDAMVDTLAAGTLRADAKQEQAWRNARAKKRARKGLKPYPTVRADARRFAEERLLQYLEDHPLLPVVQVATRELVEADAIREGLSALADDALGF